ncbi:RodZ domain-containing protein [Marinomonas balearica]|uniref:Cytoskeleton protein RodZ n=1 Tax=Marinomonas balearica TaxID=491947 RepID=A0A4R6MCK8_9GAMM|nr:RodZ domain-containing protein [Marinomonas balearica]TDO99388.1 cytoskeleton protein RodZ [Marinomonas balearica]
MTTEYKVETVSLDDNSETEIGKKLKMKRMSLGLDERQVATELKLPIEQVIALENNQFDYFRSSMFARGYLKSYCRLLDVDPRPILSVFDLQQASHEPTVKPVDKVNKQANFGDPIVILVSVVIVAVMIFLAVWWPTLERSSPNESAEPAYQESVTEQAGATNDSGVEVMQPTQEGSTVTEAVVAGELAEEKAVEDSDIEIGLSAETKAILEEAGVDPEKVAKDTARDTSEPEPVLEVVKPEYKDDVVMTFSADCWTEVRDSRGRILYSGVKSKGSTLKLNGSAPYRVVLGFARGVSSLKYKGEEFDFSSFISKDLARFELK